MRISCPAAGALLGLAASLVLFQGPLAALVRLALDNEQYSHILFVPLLSAAFLFWLRARIWSQTARSWTHGAAWLTLSLCLLLLSRLIPAGSGVSLAMAIAAFLAVLAAVFVSSFGPRALRAAGFPFGLSLLLIPLPPCLVHAAVVALQGASADWTQLLFRLTGMPALREGMTFLLPGVAIEVAEECSGIRASTALFITAILFSRLGLQSIPARLALVLFSLPLAVFKNAVRITTISWLGVYVSPDYFHSPIHHSGGPLFGLFSLAILVPVLLLLRRSELIFRRRAPRNTAPAACSAAGPSIEVRP